LPAAERDEALGRGPAAGVEDAERRLRVDRAGHRN
jgi:hypothetical protein